MYHLFGKYRNKGFTAIHSIFYIILSDLGKCIPHPMYTVKLHHMKKPSGEGGDRIYSFLTLSAAVVPQPVSVTSSGDDAVITIRIRLFPSKWVIAKPVTV